VNGPGGVLQEFKRFFAQREAFETVNFLYDVIKASNKFDLTRFDSSGLALEDMFDENWLRMGVKTGVGETIAMCLAWRFSQNL
jgi:type III restriction enzyme